MNKRLTQDDIIYFVVTDRFFGKNKRNADPSDTSIHGGTLDGILEKLDYLIELGVTTIWVTPVYENIQSHNNWDPITTIGHSTSIGSTSACLMAPVCLIRWT